MLSKNISQTKLIIKTSLEQIEKLQKDIKYNVDCHEKQIERLTEFGCGDTGDFDLDKAIHNYHVLGIKNERKKRKELITFSEHVDSIIWCIDSIPQIREIINLTNIYQDVQSIILSFIKPTPIFICNLWKTWVNILYYGNINEPPDCDITFNCSWSDANKYFIISIAKNGDHNSLTQITVDQNHKISPIENGKFDKFVLILLLIIGHYC